MKLGKSKGKSGKSPRRTKKAPPVKPRGEQLLDRIDKNPADREAWNELANGPAKRETKKPGKRSE
jgi:hypothetical protein